MLVLGIETSCDETAVALVSSDKKILGHKILSQIDIHQPYGGVVPELSSRSHIEHLHPLILELFKDASISLDNIDGVAVTAGPGLIGGLLVGVMMAKGLAAAANKPIIAVNHLEGHALTARLTSDVKFPFLLVLISGGHCQILRVDGVGRYVLYGQTVDDAIGESFDKVAKMMSLPYPGGPIIEAKSLNGDKKRFAFPRPTVGKEKNCDFSLSGLKTAVKRVVDGLGSLNQQDVCDISASFQASISDIITDRLDIAIKRFMTECPESRSVVVAGGVAANKFLFGEMLKTTNKYAFDLIAPPLKLCTDNAAMIAWVGVEKLLKGDVDILNFEPKSRWPLHK